MKKIILFSLLLILSAASFSQQTKNVKPQFTKADYLQKSKKQNTAAFVLLGSGVVLVATSLIGASNDLIIDGFFPATSSVPQVLFSAGAGCMIGSIPFFIISGKNKRKARSLSFKNEKAPQIFRAINLPQTIPSLSIKLSL